MDGKEKLDLDSEIPLFVNNNGLVRSRTGWRRMSKS
jgi:hypothetical protein